MLEELKEQVCMANIELFESGIVIYTWGNVSGRSGNQMVIKPSGISYTKMIPEDMVVVDISSGNIIEGKWRPSSDTPTHLEIYRTFTEISSIAHTHSTNAVAFAQAGKYIPALGTTHADYFYGDIPCTRTLSKEEVTENYELNTGRVIIETIQNTGLNLQDIPGILVRSHGVFTWGRSANEATYHAVVLEKIAEMALKTILLDDKISMPEYILEKHYLRKHGQTAYYGQF